MPIARMPDDLVRQLGHPDQGANAADALHEMLAGDDEILRDASLKALVKALPSPDARGLEAARVLHGAHSPWPLPLATAAFEACGQAAAQLEDEEHVELLGLVAVRAIADAPDLAVRAKPWLQSDSPGLRAVGAGAFACARQATDRSLVPLLEDPSPLVQRLAHEAVLSLASEAPDTWLPVLIGRLAPLQGEALCHGLSGVRELLQQGPTVEGPLAQALLSHGLRGLEDDDAGTRLEAAAIVGHAGRGSSQATHALTERLGDAVTEVVAEAAAALLRLGSAPAAAQSLASLAASDDVETFNAAIFALENLDDASLGRAKDAIGALLAHADDYARSAGETLQSRL